MLNRTAPLTPKPPVAKQLKIPVANTGGAAAPAEHGQSVPSGRSAAGQMVAQTKRVNVTPRPKPQRQPRTQNQRQAHRAQGGGHVPGGSKPYNPWASQFATQGEFNKAAEENAKTAYQPKLDELREQETGQKNLSQTREGDNQSIYKQYGEQAQAALEKAKAAMAEIASRQNAASTSSQQVLQAALSGGGGVSGLSSAGVNQGDYMNAALGTSNLTAGNIAGQQTDITNELAQNAANAPSAGLKEAQLTEGNELQKALNKISEQRGTVQREIPADVARSRQELSKDELARASTRLEREIAEEKLGQEGNIKGQEAKAKTVIAEADREKNATTREDAKEKAQVEREKAQFAKEHEGEKLHAKRYENALKYFNGVIKVKKGEFVKGPNIGPGEVKELEGKGEVEHRGNAMETYNALTEQYGLTALEAFHMMKGGGGYYRTFAMEHEKIYKETEDRRRGTPIQKAGKATAKELLEKAKQKPFTNPPGKPGSAKIRIPSGGNRAPVH